MTTSWPVETVVVVVVVEEMGRMRMRCGARVQEVAPPLSRPRIGVEDVLEGKSKRRRVHTGRWRTLQRMVDDRERQEREMMMHSDAKIAKQTKKNQETRHYRVTTRKRKEQIPRDRQTKKAREAKEHGQIQWHRSGDNNDNDDDNSGDDVYSRGWARDSTTYLVTNSIAALTMSAFIS